MVFNFEFIPCGRTAAVVREMLPAAGFHQVSRLEEDEKRRLQVLRPVRSLSSIQRKFKSFLLSLEYLQWMGRGGCLMRFWTTTPTRSKRKTPFGAGKVCNGVCRYRYHCIQYANGLRDSSQKIDSYSTDKLPHKNYAKGCDFQGYLALPVFEQKRGSAGVLEILTFTEIISLGAIFLEILKSVGLAIRCPPPCRKPEGCRGRSDVRIVGLYPLRNLYNLPLIQKWLNGHALFVEDGKSWVGRAHSRNHIYLAEDVRGFGISDYPLAPLPHLSRFIAYCAIPLRLIHSYHPPLVPEKFLPQHSDFDSRTDLLKSPLSTLVQQLRKYNLHLSACRTGCQGLGNGKDDKVATVQEYNVPNYSVENGQLGEASKSAKRLEGDQVQSHELGNGKEDLEVATVQEDNVQNSRVKNRQLDEASKSVKRLEDDQVQSHELGNLKDLEVATVQEDNGRVKHRQLGKSPKTVKRHEDDQVQSHELGNGKENLEVATVQEDDVQHCRVKNRQLGEASRATKRLKGDQVQSQEPSGSHVKKQLLRDEDDQEPGPNIRNRKITQDIIQNSFGRTLTDVAKELQVHKSTLKRWCRRYGIERWPSPKRNKPNPVLKPSNELGDSGSKEQECDSRPSQDHISREKQVTDAKIPGTYNFDHSRSFIVKARYNGCLVKFPFPTNSGIEALLRSLGMRFKLEVERIRIEYEDEDGDKVMISCDEDLSYHMHNLSSSGRTRMDLSVLPAAV